METSTNTKLKRSHWHDYHEPCIYLVTVTTVDRDPLLGQVEGDALKARIKLSDIGRAVWREIEKIPERHPQVMVMQHQIMPDHVHLVLRITERLPEALPLGNVVAAWKQACGKAASQMRDPLRDLKATAQNNTSDTDGLSREVAFRSPENHPYRPLFAKGYNDSILTSQGQLHHMMAYVRDNPRRLLIKRQHCDFFVIHRGIHVAGIGFDAVGNLALLQTPQMAVHCRRRWTEAEQQDYHARCLRAAEGGTVLVGAFISKAEQAIAKAVRERHLPLIHLVENGFNNLYKPIGEAFYATAEGRLLQLAPWPYHNDSHPITRQQCVELNRMAEQIAISAT
ncbi:MAG: hypothetical protein ACSW8I_01625 [bacterium]